MLTVGRREDGRKGLGLGLGFLGEGGRTMVVEDNELEEGEACSSQDDDSCIDPDSLSYIDKKIQDVLGHFQKDFEGGVSAENLGAKFGGYGSFLPTYQRSPTLFPQLRSPPKLENQNVMQSPYNPSFEGTRQNHSLIANTSSSRSNTAIAPLPNNTAKKDIYINTNSRESISQQNSFNKAVNGNDPSSLKVRLKVGPENNLSSDKAAIYIDLGLDMSPSLSYENSPNGSRGVSPEFHGFPDESPKTIIQLMTSFTVPGGLLLSPLQDSLFQLIQKNASFLKCKGHEGMPEKTVVLADLPLPVRKNYSQMQMKIKSGEKNWRLMELKDSKNNGKTSTICSREIGGEMPAGQELVSKTLNIPELSASRSDAEEETERLIIGHAAKGATKMFDNLAASSMASTKDRMMSPDPASNRQFDMAKNVTSNKASSSADAAMSSRVKFSMKPSTTVKVLGARNTNNHTDASCSQRDGLSKVEKDFGLSNINSHSSGYKGRNKEITVPSNHAKQNSSDIASSLEVDGAKTIQGKAGQSNAKPLTEVSKDSSSGISSAALGEKINYATADLTEKVKVLKPHKDSNGDSFRESRDDFTEDTPAKQLESGVGLVNKAKQKAVKHRTEKELAVSSQNFREKALNKKDERTLISGAFDGDPPPAPRMSSAPDTGAAATVHAPVVIQENWVCCDLCQKWRLLPYGTNPDNLPKKWQCSLLSWLPGMNSCHVSEEETTKALNAVYMAPAPDYHGGSAIVQLGQNLELASQTMRAFGKKKSSLKDASNIPSRSTLSEIPNSVKKSQQTSIDNGSLNDANHYAYETNSSNKGGLDNSSKSVDINAEKQKHKKKHKLDACYSDGGDFIEKSLKHSKSKSKREFNQDDVRKSKKPKKETLQYVNKDWHSIDAVAEKVFDESTCGHLTSKVIVNSHPRHSDFPLAKDSKPDGHVNSSSSSKKLKYGDTTEQFFGSDMEISGKQGFSSKKRKVKDWQKSQCDKEALMIGQNLANHQVISEGYLSGNDQTKDKKVKLSKSEGRGSRISKMDGRMDKKGNITKTVLPASGDHLCTLVHEDVQYDLGKEHVLSQSKGNIQGFQRDLMEFDCSKRNVVYAEAPTAANSSSSKVSGSRRSKANHLEAKGSPVESVSSSPFRISNIDSVAVKKQTVQMDDATNFGSSARAIPRRCSDIEVDGGSDRSNKGRKGSAFSLQEWPTENQMAGDSSSRGIYDFKEKDTNHLAGGKSGQGMDVIRGAHDELLPNGFSDVYVVGNTRNAANQQGKHLHENPHKDDVQAVDKVNMHHLSNSSSQRKSGKSSSGSKERHRGYKLDLGTDKLKASGSCREKKDSISMKNVGNCQYEADIDAHEYSTFPEALRTEICKFNDKKIEKDSLEKKDSGSNWSTGKRDSSLAFAAQENRDGGNSSALPNQHKDLDSRVPFTGGRCSKSNLPVECQVEPSYHKEKAQNHSSTDRNDRPELPSGSGRSQLNLPSEDKAGIVSSSLMGSRSEIYGVEAVNAEAAKVVKQLRQPDGQIALHHNNLRHAINGPDTSSPMRRDVHFATSAVMKEARDLKHTANRLKNEGLELESTGLYFEAALKFLHVASLMEPLNFDNTKQEAAQMYSDTAKLCQFVAHEYDKLKDMAAAALAYKCVEVAYLKAAYYKSPNASKDRHDLQTALQILPPGESPSSSASDVDNVNNQATVGKIASAKGVSSPQVPGNNLVAARLHPQVLRLLHYTNDLNYAFEATRKSQNAIAAASVNMTRDKMDGISSVRKVLDFNFHNVEGLLRLIRFSKESIGR